MLALRERKVTAHIAIDGHRSKTGKPRKTAVDGRKDFLDMMDPAYLAFDGKADGEFAFGCVTGGLHCRKIPAGVTWTGNVSGEESLIDTFHSLRRPAKFSTPCLSP